MRCPICWKDCGEWKIGGWLQLGVDYGGMVWVCSQECANLIYRDDATFMEFYHNFEGRPIRYRGQYYEHCSDLMPFKDWIVKLPQDDLSVVRKLHKPYIVKKRQWWEFWRLLGWGKTYCTM